MFSCRVRLGHLGKLCLNAKPFTTSPISCLNQKVRKDKGLPLNPNAHGILTDGPDYSFLDGRITPYGVGQRKRIVKQKETLEQVISLTKEVDFAVQRHEQILLQEEQKRISILDSKLKPKGKELLLKSSKTN